MNRCSTCRNEFPPWRLLQCLRQTAKPQPVHSPDRYWCNASFLIPLDDSNTSTPPRCRLIPVTQMIATYLAFSDTRSTTRPWQTTRRNAVPLPAGASLLDVVTLRGPEPWLSRTGPSTRGAGRDRQRGRSRRHQGRIADPWCPRPRACTRDQQS